MPTLDSIIQRFTADLRAHYRDEVLDKLSPGSSKKTPALRLAAPSRKRTPQEIDDLTYELHTYVLQHRGQRIEQISEGMRVSTKELVIPVKRLAEKGLIVTKGQKRATQYWGR